MYSLLLGIFPFNNIMNPTAAARSTNIISEYIFNEAEYENRIMLIKYSEDKNIKISFHFMNFFASFIYIIYPLTILTFYENI